MDYALMMTGKTLRFWWRMTSYLVRSRTVLDGVMELTGIGMVLYGLYLIQPLVCIIGSGVTCIVLAQGLAARGDGS